MTYFNEFGQGRLGWRSPSSGGGGITPSTLWNSIYSVYNADSVGSSSLKTSLYAVYNGESNANDSFGSNNGTAQGGLTYGTGKIGTAFQFNGTNAYVQLPNNSLNFLSSFTIGWWMNITGNSGDSQQPISNAQRNAGGSTIWGYGAYIQNNLMNFQIYDGTNYVPLTCNISSIFNTWAYVEIEREWNVGSKIRINGNVVASNTSTINPAYRPDVAHTPSIGVYKNTTGTSYFMRNGGKIDAVNVWNRVLTASEITELYNSGNGAQYITNDFYKPTTNDALNTNNGTAQGGLTYGVGKVGTAFQFNGTNSFINLPTSSHQLTTFSINFWVFNPAAQTTTIATNFGNDGQNKGWYLGLITTNGHGIRFVAFNNNVNILALNATATATGGYTNRWSMATLTVNGTSVKMYLDGSLVSSGTMSNTINYTTTTYPLIGGYRVNNGGVSGILANNTRLDAFNIWNKELSATEITELYNSGNGKQYPN